MLERLKRLVTSVKGGPRYFPVEDRLMYWAGSVSGSVPAF